MSRDIDTMIGGLATVTDRQAADLLPDDAADALARPHHRHRRRARAA
ncbi:hypothetical protein LUX57_39735 [Actinomadura madurae]|nr:hypothetical protein [Actinomadura madurae]MCP9970560.1 hypothetical protein [Actinomadura madurae]